MVQLLSTIECAAPASAASLEAMAMESIETAAPLEAYRKRTSPQACTITVAGDGDGRRLATCGDAVAVARRHEDPKWRQWRRERVNAALNGSKRSRYAPPPPRSRLY